MKKIFLLLLIALLAFTNVRAETFDPPVEVGNTYEFTQIEMQNCSMPFRSSEELVDREIVHENSLLITGIDIETKKIELESTYTYFQDPEPMVTYSNRSKYYIIDDFGYHFRPLSGNSAGDIKYTPMIREFIEPDFESMSSLIADHIMESGADNYLHKADKIVFMGEGTIEEGLEKLDTDTREWSIFVDLSSYLLIYDTLEITKEFKYNKNGVLDYNKISKKVKVAGADETCFYESEYKNTTSFFSFLPGFKIYFPLILIPIVLLRKFKQT